MVSFINDLSKHTGFARKAFIRWVIVFCCIGATIWTGTMLLEKAQKYNVSSTVIQKTLAIIGEAFGKQMLRDGSGNVNVLVAGYGGRKHSGGFLTDALMLVSRNPERGAVTMISIPRDLYISLKDKENDVYLEGRINEVFTALYGKYKREIPRNDHTFIDPRLAVLSGYIPTTSRKNPADVWKAKLYIASVEPYLLSGVTKQEILSHPCFDESFYTSDAKQSFSTNKTQNVFDDFIDCLAFHEAAAMTVRQYKTLFGLDIPYYVFFDFAGFEQVIDILGGIDIYVPEPIYDPAYPSGIWGRVITFSISSGWHHMDGATALKYARSRHTTSDFDRASRQQRITKAVYEKVKNQGLLTNLSKVKGLYETYKTTVQTNISFDHAVGMAQYAQKIKHIFSFVLTSRYSELQWQKTVPGGFLYTPVSESGSLFGGASVILPNGATPYNIGVYDVLHNFVHIATHYQGYLIENPAIRIGNGIDPAAKILSPAVAKSLPNKRAVKLRKYGFNIFDTQESSIPMETTTVLIKQSGAYQETINVLRLFLDIPTVIVTGWVETGIDMKLILGNDYAYKRGREIFNYDR